MAVGATSSNAIDGATVIAAATGVTGRAVSGPGVLTVPLSTLRATPGRRSLTITVPAGHDRAGVTWPAAAATTPITLSPEDIALTAHISSGHSRRVSVRVDTRDSASGRYSGPRREIGPRRTVLGLSRATIRMTVHAGPASGRTLFTTRRAAVDTGVRGNGDGHLTFAWRAPRAGRYTVVARQTGSSYTPAQTSATFSVR